MEFPPEILAIIREYSKPCFRYGILYKRILKLTALHEWTKLKEALQSKPDAIMPFLLEYEKAQMEWLAIAYRQPRTYIDTYGFTPEVWYQIKLSIRTRTFQELALKINLET
jgi:hypothetical protein